MIAKVHINLWAVESTQDLFDIFASTFSFPAYFGNNWDALYDMMSSLDPAAAVFHTMKRPLTGVHLILDEFDICSENLSQGDLSVFKSILVDLSVNKKLRSDHLSFTFESRYFRE
jgi:RNAse (barnase) inhibitor barstar